MITLIIDEAFFSSLGLVWLCLAGLSGITSITLLIYVLRTRINQMVISNNLACLLRP